MEGPASDRAIRDRADLSHHQVTLGIRMVTKIDLGEISLEVVKKDIKNLNLRVYPPAGKVLISAPRRMSLEVIRRFALSKLGWIRQQQQKIHEQQREPPSEYLNAEIHYLWGQRYRLQVIESEETPTVMLQGDEMLLRVRSGVGVEKSELSLRPGIASNSGSPSLPLSPSGSRSWALRWSGSSCGR